MPLATKFHSALALLAMLFVGGCGGVDGARRVDVSGAVTVDGEALSTGVIRFLPTDGNTGPAVNGTIQQGAYRMSGENGPVSGVYRVLVTKTTVTSGKMAATESADNKRSEWTQTVTVPEQDSFVQNLELNTNDPQ